MTEKENEELAALIPLQGRIRLFLMEETPTQIKLHKLIRLLGPTPAFIVRFLLMLVL